MAIWPHRVILRLAAYRPASTHDTCSTNLTGNGNIVPRLFDLHDKVACQQQVTLKCRRRPVKLI
eukprot:3135968-Amphidinium_carterae.1